MNAQFTSTVLAPLASRLLLILSVVLGQCCLVTLPAHALGLVDGMPAHADAQHPHTDAALAAHAVHQLAQAPDACGIDAPRMTERTVQWHPVLPVARVAFTAPGGDAPQVPPAAPANRFRHSLSRLQVYRI